MGRRPESYLDRPAARVAAGFVALACFGALLAIHWEDFSQPETGANGKVDPFQACLAERSAGIDKMQRDGVVDARRAALFKTGAAAMCRAAADKKRAGPPGR